MSDVCCWMPIADAPSDELGLVAHCRLPLGHIGRHEPLSASASVDPDAFGSAGYLLRPPAPVDLAGRFRAAADAAEKAAYRTTARRLRAIAEQIEASDMPAHVVEAIGRALLGGGEGQ
jgi:hypothetical protein